MLGDSLWQALPASTCVLYYFRGFRAGRSERHPLASPGKRERHPGSRPLLPQDGRVRPTPLRPPPSRLAVTIRDSRRSPCRAADRPTRPRAEPS